MRYGELIRLYFERCTALQWYWTIYVVVIGGLLAFSSLRHRADLATAILITILYCFFAYKNLDAIRDVTFQRAAVLQSIRDYHVSSSEPLDIQQQRRLIEPTLVAPTFDGTRTFDIVSDLLT